MAFYSKSQKELLYDQIKAANPDTELKSADDFTVKPTITGTSATTPSELTLQGKSANGVVAQAKVTVQRLNMGNLFPAGWNRIFFEHFNGKTPVTTWDVVQLINKRCGLNILKEHVANADTALTSNLQAKYMNLASVAMPQYFTTGSIMFFWERRYPLEEVLPKRKLTVDQTQVLSIKAFHVDFTDQQSTLDAHDVSVPLTSGSSTAVAIAGMLATATALGVTVGTGPLPGTTHYDLTGWTLSKPLIRDVGDADFMYRKLYVLTPPTVGYGLETAKIYLHAVKRSATTGTYREIPTSDYGDLM